MGFTEGFIKTAEYDESKEYEKANKVDAALSKLESPASEPMQAVPVGTRVAYYSSNRGWKEGPWSNHMKGCSKDTAMRPARMAYEKQVRAEVEKTHQKDMRWKVISDRVEHAFPYHDHGEWKEGAVRIGDAGTITRVEKLKSQPTRYYVRWDKHPDCEWGNYGPGDLKLLPGAAKK